MRSILEARRECYVALPPLADAGEECYTLCDFVGMYGVDIRRVPVRVFPGLWVRFGKLLVACGQGLEGEARTMVMERGDDIVRREVRRYEGSDVEVVL